MTTQSGVDLGRNGYTDETNKIVDAAKERIRAAAKVAADDIRNAQSLRAKLERLQRDRQARSVEKNGLPANLEFTQSAASSAEGAQSQNQAAVQVDPSQLDLKAADDPALKQLLRDLWKTRQVQAARPRVSSSAKSSPIVIKNLQSFILNAIPYGTTEIGDVQNSVGYDGPSLPSDLDIPDAENRPPLFWYFDGEAYKIVRAVTFVYKYKNINASGVYVSQSDSIYVGFEGAYDSEKYVPTTGLETSPVMRDETQADAISIPVAFKGTEEKLNTALDRELRSLDIDDFRGSQVGWVDFAGPARDATSAEPFKLTLADLFNTPDEFNKLLYWHFAGKPQRVAKAMRLQCVDKNGVLRNILVGFQGGSGSVPG